MWVWCKWFLQANLENVRELKLGMRNMGQATYIANFSTALITAFDILQQVSTLVNWNLVYLGATILYSQNLG